MEIKKRPKFLPVKRGHMDPKAKFAMNLLLEGLLKLPIVAADDEIEGVVNRFNNLVDAFYTDWEKRGWVKDDESED